MDSVVILKICGNQAIVFCCFVTKCKLCPEVGICGIDTESEAGELLSLAGSATALWENWVKLLHVALGGGVFIIKLPK